MSVTDSNKILLNLQDRLNVYRNHHKEHEDRYLATRDAKVEKQRHETIHLQTQILNSTNCNTGSKSKSTKSGPSGLGSRTAKRSHPSSSSNNCNGNITINPGSNAAKIANNGPASSISGSASELQDRKSDIKPELHLNVQTTPNTLINRLHQPNQEELHCITDSRIGSQPPPPPQNHNINQQQQQQHQLHHLHQDQTDLDKFRGMKELKDEDLQYLDNFQWSANGSSFNGSSEELVESPEFVDPTFIRALLDVCMNQPGKSRGYPNPQLIPNQMCYSSIDTRQLQQQQQQNMSSSSHINNYHPITSNRVHQQMHPHQSPHQMMPNHQPNSNMNPNIRQTIKSSQHVYTNNLDNRQALMSNQMGSVNQGSNMNNDSRHNMNNRSPIQMVPSSINQQQSYSPNHPQMQMHSHPSQTTQHPHQQQQPQQQYMNGHLNSNMNYMESMNNGRISSPSYQPMQQTQHSMQTPSPHMNYQHQAEYQARWTR